MCQPLQECSPGVPHADPRIRATDRAPPANRPGHEELRETPAATPSDSSESPSARYDRLTLPRLSTDRTAHTARQFRSSDRPTETAPPEHCAASGTFQS